MSYREEKLATAMVGAKRIAERPDVDSVYLAGSLTAGLGSPTSDVDVFVLTSATGDDTGTARQQRVQDTRLDIESYSVAWADAVLQKLALWESSRKRLRYNALSKEELDVLIRLRDIVVVTDSADLRRLRATLAGAEDRLRQMALSTWALEANGNLSDFKGAVQDDDRVSAGIVGQSLAVCAGKAVTTAAGDLYLGAKWVYQQLRRSVGGTFPHDRFVAWQNGAWASGATDAEFREFLFFQQTLMAAAQLLGWHGCAVEQWPFWEVGSGAYRRNPQYNTIRLTEGVLLNNELQRQVEVQPSVALVWALCNGTDEDAIIDAATRLAPHVTGPGQDDPLDADRVRGILDVLHRRGLVSRDLFR